MGIPRNCSVYLNVTSILSTVSCELKLKETFFSLRHIGNHPSPSLNTSLKIFEPQGLSDFTVAETPANTYVLTSTLDPANAPVLAVIRHKHGPIANVWTSRNDGLIHRYSWRYRRIRTPRNIRIKLTRAQSHRIIRTVCGLRGFRTASPAQLFDIFLSHASPHLPTGENASLAKLRHLWHLRIQDSADLQPWLLLKKINLPVMGGL